MELSNETIAMFEQLPQPVFLVKDNKVVFANHSAKIRDVQTNYNVLDLITIGHKEFQHFTSGKLLLTVAVSGILYNTIVTTIGAYRMFCLETEYSKPELRAFAIAAQAMREPLTNVLLGVDKLIPDPSIQESPDLLSQMRSINKSIYQMHRAVRNMSDAATIGSGTKTELRDICSLLSEIVEKANTLLSKTGHRIKLVPLRHSVCCQISRDNIERAILNLISNAVKYATEAGTVEISLRATADKLYISVQGDCEYPREIISTNIFSAFTREPSITTEHSGIGLGLTIVHSVAAAHKGTLLVDHPDKNRLRFTMSISTELPNICTVNSPTMPIEHAGGFDSFLVELADILPPDLFE